MAGDLFADLGKHEEAIDAYTWALSVDELAPATLEAFAGELAAAKNADAAWMVKHWPRHRPTLLAPELRCNGKLGKVDLETCGRGPRRGGGRSTLLAQARGSCSC